MTDKKTVIGKQSKITVALAIGLLVLAFYVGVAASDIAGLKDWKASEDSANRVFREKMITDINLIKGKLNINE